MNHATNRKYCLIGALFITFSLYFLFSISGALYTFTDNITVGVVTSGMYGDNNMCQYLHPLFCLIIKELNPILSMADVFAVLTHAFLLLGICFVSYAAIETSFRKPLKLWGVEDYISRALMILVITYFVLGLKIFGINYTVQTAAIIAEGIVVLFYALHTKKGKFWIIAGTFLVFAGFLGRVEACLLFLPFIALELFTEIVRNKKRLNWIRGTAAYILPSLLVIVILLVSKWAFLKIEPYRSDAEYNKYRTVTGDYPMETYGVSYKDWDGIDKETYLAVTHWNLSDTENIDTEILKKIAEAGSRNDYQSTEEGLKRALQEMKRQSMKVDVHVMTLTALAIILTLWCLISMKSIWLKLEALCSLGGGFIILFYFTFIGRAPLRVWQCVLIDVLTILILVMIKDGTDRTNCLNTSLPSGQEYSDIEGTELPKEREQQKRLTVHRPATVVFQMFLCVVLYFGIGQVISHSHIHAPISPLTARIGADDSAYAETFEDDALYIWPQWYKEIPDYFSNQNKLPTQRVIDHNIAAGDWIYGQVYFQDFLQRIGAPNPALALLNRPDTYLMEGREELMLSYMQHHYEKDLVLVYSHKVNGKKAYRLVRRDTGSQAQSKAGE